MTEPTRSRVFHVSNFDIRISSFLISCVLLLFSLGPVARADSVDDLAQATVIVYNRKDPDSIALAYFYAKARHIPENQLLGLECSTEEEISRQEYDQTIAEPVRKIFTARGWWTLASGNEDHPVVRTSRIHFVALMRGMPLKIRAATDYAGDQPQPNQPATDNKASVDSELAVVGLCSRQISGAAHNPYFQSFRPIAELNPTPLILVCRLDGPTPEIVRHMITDAVETEKSGLWGRAFVDGADHSAGALAEGDAWLKGVVKNLRRVGVPAVYDTEPAVFPAGYPMSKCALYFGWYAGGVAGPFAEPDFKFLPGAIAVHLHSFSANTLRDPKANWVAPLLSKGAAASLGNVYEPYLQLTANLDIFSDRLLHGFTFAESAYMASRVLSWMNVAVGDPLYRPYANWLQLDPASETQKLTAWRAYHEFAIENGGLKPDEYMKKARAAAARTGNGTMLEDLGLIEKENGAFAAAVSYLQQARALDLNSEDILRTVLEQADALLMAGDKQAALAIVRSAGRLVPTDTRSATLLKEIENKITPPPPTPKPAPL